MKEPKQPIKPRQPSKPSEFLPGEKRRVSVYTGESLAYILEKIGKDVNLKEVTFDATSGYYDDYDYEFTWTGKPKPNPKYKEQLKRYEADMEDYRLQMTAYNVKMQEYNVAFKKYLKWFHETELKKLG